MLSTRLACLARDCRGAANPKVVAVIAIITLPVAGGYALGYDVGGEALHAFQSAIADVMRLVGA